MASQSPAAKRSVTVTGEDGSTRAVTFTLGRLLRVEKAVGKGVNEFVFGELSPFLQQSAQAAEGEDWETAGETGEAELTAKRRDATIAALRKVSLQSVAAFVGGCLDVEPDQLEAVVAPGRLMVVFYELVPAFIEAVGVINGAGQEPAQADPQPPASQA